MRLFPKSWKTVEPVRYLLRKIFQNGDFYAGRIKNNYPKHTDY